MLSKWFPDKRGLITGIAVAGFGFGAVITAPVAQALLSGTSHKTSVFLPLGVAYLIAVLLGASFFRNPPAGYQVPGFTPAVGGRAVAGTRVYTFGEALRTRQWYLLTLILTLNVTCGISFISQATDAAQAVAGASAATAAGLVGVLGLFNGAGRVFWAWLSDRIGRMTAFIGMLVLQGICFLILPHAAAFWLFAILAAVVYLAYGGGFGTMPATAGDHFGLRGAGAIYGLMLVGWSIGGVVGPLLVANLINGKSYTVAFTTIGILALASVALPLVTRPPGVRATTTTPARVPETAGP
jgi:OFA family oxalate/formate antiporter-like MFS transporter